MAAVTANSNPDVPVPVAVSTPTAVSAWNKKPEAAESGAGNGSGSGNGSGNGNGDGVPAVVMGAELWPSLSECTSKTSSSSKIDLAGSSISHKVKRIDTPSSTTASMSVRSPPSNSPKPTKNNSNHHSTSNHGRPARQKSMKQANGGNSHQSSQPAGEGAHSHHHNHGSPKPNSVGSENPGRDNVQNHGQREPAQRNAGGDHPHQRNPFRKGNGGSRGDGSHQNYGGRRSDQERGNHDFNHQRNFNGREASMQPRGAPKNFLRGPPVPASFIYAPPGPPFVNPTMPVFLPPGMQFVAPFYLPLPCPELYLDLMRQIDYYFSHENLVRDVYLREKMDEQGWVPVEEIAKFQRVKCLAKDTSLILEAVRYSNVVEVQGDKIRCRDDWHKWTMKVPTSSGLQSPKSPAVSGITDQVGSVSLDEKINHPGNVKDQVALQASSGGSNTASQMSVNEANPNGC